MNLTDRSRLAVLETAVRRLVQQYAPRQIGEVLADHGGLAGLTDDDHPQYHNDARGDARYDPLGASSAAVAAHESAPDPHPTYLTAAEGAAAFEPLGVVAGAIAAHESAPDPHPTYLTAAEGAATFAALSHGHVAADVSDFDTQVRTNRLDQMAAPSASVSFADQQATSFRVENRTSDPSSPTTGQIWLRTDL